ncbi:PREDICTED: UDP-glycosyltransferase 76E6-like [Camelina sativa]|uniref:UDP-glycosyltransferase 76E6-like n=1 Tax=Camelina sativa TaxID=90675 RepID=A0ABM0YX66_CAMSA|nr:PREDICTED: UDP-glycosyltransferase 76E6-like [Camelina sativa]
MLNNGTKKLDHILNIGKTDKCGLGYEGKVSNSDPVFVSSGKITSASGTVSETASKTVSENVYVKEHSKRIFELQSAPRQVFRPVCHHCGVVGHIRPRYFRLLRERSQMDNAYDVRFQGPTCYHCGVQGHLTRNCFRFIQEVIWRSKAQEDMGSIPGFNGIESLPKEVGKMISERGYIVKRAPQREVFGHPVAGGFWTHCGWNSILESIAEGVPMIWFQVEGSKVDRGEVDRAVKRLMVENEGAGMQERALGIKQKLKASVKSGGTSYNAFNELVKYLKTM